MQVVSPTPAAVYTGVSNAIATISRVEGFRSLWKGVSSVVVGAGELSPGTLAWRRTSNSSTGPAHAVYFATYEGVKEWMGGNEGDGHHPLAAGMLEIIQCMTETLLITLQQPVALALPLPVMPS